MDTGMAYACFFGTPMRKPIRTVFKTVHPLHQFMNPIPPDDGKKRHALKTWPVYFEALWHGSKTFEVRKNDRDFKKGDILMLMEYDPEKDSYDRKITAVITYVFLGGQFGLQEGHCVLGLYVKERLMNDEDSEIYLR